MQVILPNLMIVLSFSVLGGGNRFDGQASERTSDSLTDYPIRRIGSVATYAIHVTRFDDLRWLVGWSV